MKSKPPIPITKLDLFNKRVFIRVDFNVPVKKRMLNYEISDPSRILAALPTIKYALEQNATVILCSHFGRPGGKADPVFSLKRVGTYLAEQLGQEVYFSESCIGLGIDKITNLLPPQSVILLENVRFHKEERNEDVHFYHQLAAFTDVYVNDAFGACHRSHASITGLPKLIKKKGMGFLVQQELKALNKLIHNPARPFWVVLGGAKVSDKIPLIEQLISRVDGFCIGGAMAFPFLKALGHEIGNSKCEDDKLTFAKHLLDATQAKKIPLLLPVDHLIAKYNSEQRAWYDHKSLPTVSIPNGYCGIDIGPATLKKFTHALVDANLIFWNGPMGVYEDSQAKRRTTDLAKFLAERNESQAEVVVGGGDSASTVHKLNLTEQFHHVSTGGGASLTYLEKGTLPGLEALVEPSKGG